MAPKANALGDVWEIPQEFKNDHPAPFPVELTDRIVKSCTGDIVLDPFMGSGTTALSAINYGWDYVGIELSDQYCRMARKRIQNHKKQLEQEELESDTEELSIAL